MEKEGGEEEATLRQRVGDEGRIIIEKVGKINNYYCYC